LTELLQELGYRVRACAGYGEARGCLRRAHYDLAVVDLSLPGVGGADARLEGYRLLDAARMAAIPALVVTGAATAEEIERAYSEHGVFACLEKQAFDRHAFLQTVQEACTTGPKPGDLAILTPREREVLALLARGATNRHIAETLVITQNTVKRHLKAIFEKLGVHTRAAAAAKAISLGLPGRPTEMTRDS
jgi:DNA-binding NarL/FixJ family response regulator